MSLRDRFGAELVKFLKRQELNARVQKAVEKLESYIIDIQARSNRLKPSPDDRLQVFVQNLLSHLREYVILGNPKTVEEAKRLARLKASISPTPASTQAPLADETTLNLIKGLLELKTTPGVAATGPEFRNQGPTYRELDSLREAMEKLTLQIPNMSKAGQRRAEENPNRVNFHCSYSNRTEDGRPICGHCNRVGHYTRSCYTFYYHSHSEVPSGQG